MRDDATLNARASPHKLVRSGCAPTRRHARARQCRHPFQSPPVAHPETQTPPRTQHRHDRQSDQQPIERMRVTREQRRMPDSRQRNRRTREITGREPRRTQRRFRRAGGARLHQPRPRGPSQHRTDDRERDPFASHARRAEDPRRHPRALLRHDAHRQPVHQPPRHPGPDADHDHRRDRRPRAPPRSAMPSHRPGRREQGEPRDHAGRQPARERRRDERHDQHRRGNREHQPAGVDLAEAVDADERSGSTTSSTI